MHTHINIIVVFVIVRGEEEEVDVTSCFLEIATVVSDDGGSVVCGYKVVVLVTLEWNLFVWDIDMEGVEHLIGVRKVIARKVKARRPTKELNVGILNEFTGVWSVLFLAKEN